MERGERENWQMKQAKHDLREKKAGGANRLCFDAAHLRYQILLSVDLIGHIADCQTRKQ